MGRPKKNCSKPLIDPQPNGDCLPAFKKVTGKLGEDCCKLDKKLYNQMVKSGSTNMTATNAKIKEMEPKKRTVTNISKSKSNSFEHNYVINSLAAKVKPIDKGLADSEVNKNAEVAARIIPSSSSSKIFSKLPCHKLNGKKNKTKCRDRKDCVWSDIKKSCRDRSNKPRTVKNRQYVG